MKQNTNIFEYLKYIFIVSYSNWTILGTNMQAKSLTSVSLEWVDDAIVQTSGIVVQFVLSHHIQSKARII